MTSPTPWQLFKSFVQEARAKGGLVQTTIPVKSGESMPNPIHANLSDPTSVSHTIEGPALVTVICDVEGKISLRVATPKSTKLTAVNPEDNAILKAKRDRKQ